MIILYVVDVYVSRQGPHISASGAPRRKTSTNTFGPADAAGRARKTSMSAPVSFAETSVRQLLDELVDEAVDYSSGPAPPPGPPHHALTERPEEEEREAVDGRANPAYEPNADDPADAAAVRLPDATTDETETDDERETTPPPPPPSRSQPVPPPPSQTHQPQPHTHQPKTTAADQKVLAGVVTSTDVGSLQFRIV